MAFFSAICVSACGWDATNCSLNNEGCSSLPSLQNMAIEEMAPIKLHANNMDDMLERICRVCLNKFITKFDEWKGCLNIDNIHLNLEIDGWKPSLRWSNCSCLIYTYDEYRDSTNFIVIFFPKICSSFYMPHFAAEISSLIWFYSWVIFLWSTLRLMILGGRQI